MQTFSFEGEVLQTQFIESSKVVPGVTCDVYSFVGDETKDLGLVTMEPGSKTPVQRVLDGDRTIEGLLSGLASLLVRKSDGTLIEYSRANNEDEPFVAEVEIGDLMQWHAGLFTFVQFYEVCIPPYADGRYENLEAADIRDVV
jgi:hypothetical protein